MPLDVIMPALGMAQDTGLIVAWIKQPGEAVSAGDVLFEVETDKATMEVEAAGDGFLTHVSAAAGEAVPVGQVIAKISETADAEKDAPGTAQARAATPSSLPDGSAQDSLPEGHTIIMPTLGMAQDTGLLVAWVKQPGEAVAADDVLFEVETDKSTVEVPAGFDGFLAATLAEAGEDVPVGQTIAIISEAKPFAPVVRSAKAQAASAGEKPAMLASPVAADTKPASNAAPKAAKRAATNTPPAVSKDGRILASPKARRLALEQGLDMARLAQAGHPQPYHVADLEVLRALPTPGQGAAASASPASLHLTATVEAPGFDAFALWARDNGQEDSAALLAGFAATALGRPTCVTVEALNQSQSYQATSNSRLGQVAACPEPDCSADLLIRDLRWSRLTALQLGGESLPTLSILQTGSGDGLRYELTLEAQAEHLSAQQAITLLSNFADRLAQPLRHLL